MENNLKKIQCFFLLTATALGLFLLFSRMKGLLPVIMPFLIAAICAYFLAPPTEMLSKLFGVPKWIPCVFLVITFYSTLFTLIYVVISRLIRELAGISGYLSVIEKEIPLYIEKTNEFICRYIPSGFLDFAEDKNPAQILSPILSQTIQKLAGTAANSIPRTLTKIPNILVFTAVTVLATFYFTADFRKICRFIIFQLPPKARVFIYELRTQFFDTTSKYALSYVSIAAITFAELFAGLLVIRREYAFVLALFITLVDILPFFGSGFVLIPWAAWEFFFASKPTSLKLLMLYLIITVVRQIIEPKILGSFIGLYPLITLFSIYAGVRIAGIAGIFIFPVLAIVLKNLNEKKLLSLYKVPPENCNEKLTQARQKYKKFKRTEK